MYNKKEHGQAFESKDENWRGKHDYKTLKSLSYQVHKTEKEEDKTDQELPSWIKSKDEINELKDRCLGFRKNKLKTNTDKYQYDFSYMKS